MNTYKPVSLSRGETLWLAFNRDAGINTFAVVGLLLCGAIIVWSIVTFSRAKKDLAALEKSRAWTQARVLQKVLPQGRGHWSVLVELPDGREISTMPMDGNFYDTLNPNSPVDVQVWNGEIVAVQANGLATNTTDNPENDVLLMELFIFMFSLFLVLFSGAFLKSLGRSYREIRVGTGPPVAPQLRLPTWNIIVDSDTLQLTRRRSYYLPNPSGTVVYFSFAALIAANLKVESHWSGGVILVGLGIPYVLYLVSRIIKAAKGEEYIFEKGSHRARKNAVPFDMKSIRVRHGWRKNPNTAYLDIMFPDDTYGFLEIAEPHEARDLEEFAKFLAKFISCELM